MFQDVLKGNNIGLHIHEVVISTFHLLSLRGVVIVLVQHVDGHIDSISSYVPRLSCIERLGHVTSTQDVWAD